MANNEEADLESAETQEESPTEEKTPEEETEKPVSKDVKKPESEPEFVWGDLKGKAQDRFVQMVRKNKALEAEAARLRAQIISGGPPMSPQETSSQQPPTEKEIQEAVSKLRGYGVVTREDLQAGLDRLYLDREHDRLQTKFSGAGDQPKYIPDEVEDYARTHGYGGNLEAAFWDMYRDEMIDAEFKKRGAKGPKGEIYTEKPTASFKVGERPLTLTSLRERLRKADGAEWWQKNKDKIEPLLKKLSQA